MKFAKGEVSGSSQTFEVDTNGILTVSYKNLETGESNHVDITRGPRTLSRKEIDNLQETARSFREDDQKEINRLREKNMLTTACTHIRYKMQTDDNLMALSERMKTKLQKICQGHEDWTKENPSESTETFRERRAELLAEWATVSNNCGIKIEDPGNTEIKYIC